VKEPRVFSDADALGAALAADIVADIAAAARDGRRYLLGCPGGRSLRSTYRAVATRLRGSPVDLAHVWLPDPREPERYDERIAAAGGIDLFLLATGVSDGHVAFNPPGTDLSTVTRVIDLADTTRQDNLATFPHLATLDNVPRRGVSVGLATIARLSRRAVLVTTGQAKATSVARVLGSDAWQRDWPATVIHACRDAEVWVDRAAVGR
jgi:glucosamine-6-phosphate deaminase